MASRFAPLVSHAVFAACLAVLSASTVAYAQEKVSQNYLHVISLPRAGEPQMPPSDLDRAVAEHNKLMEANPAPKNRNRIVYLSGPNQYKPVMFPVTEGSPLIDGLGKPIGKLDSSIHSVALNFGQRKRIGGAECVFAFGIQADGIGGLSAWIPESALKPSPEREQFAKEIATDVHDEPADGDAPVRYTISGDTPEHWKNDRLKVIPHVNGAKEKHACASDYVTRPGDIVYLLTALPGHGGVAGDAFKTGAEFIPAAGVPRAAIPLYLPTDATPDERHEWDTNTVPHTMEFLYGRVGERYGWIPAATLRPRVTIPANATK